MSEKAGLVGIDPQQRVDWWRVMDDLSKAGMTMEAVSAAVSIPVSTLAGYKNSNVEPKHADGERLVELWRRRVMPTVPMTRGSVRNGERNAGPA